MRNGNWIKQDGKNVKILFILKIKAFYVHIQMYMWIYAERGEIAWGRWGRGKGEREGGGKRKGGEHSD